MTPMPAARSTRQLGSPPPKLCPRWSTGEGPTTVSAIRRQPALPGPDWCLQVAWAHTVLPASVWSLRSGGVVSTILTKSVPVIDSAAVRVGTTASK